MGTTFHASVSLCLTGLVSMWKKGFLDHRSNYSNYETSDYKTLLRYIDQLARHKLGYPVSLLTYLGVIDNRVLGIMPGTLANILLNNVGDPFKDSETSLLEVKKHEREIIRILEKYYGLEVNAVRGYVTTGGTEGNFASLWWSKRYLINRVIDTLIEKDDFVKTKLKEEQELMAAIARTPNNEIETRLNQLQKIVDNKNLMNTYKNDVQQLLTPTIFYSKGPTHYSVPKIAEILHLNIRAVNSNEDGSLNLDEFKKELIFHLGAHPYSPIVVIANIGTTVTGAIDDVPKIKKIIEEIKPTPVYTIHMDGALTGFVLPILKPFGDVKNYFDAIGVNTLAVSAHKYPGLSQPCGIILAEKNFYEKAFEKSERNIEYVGNISDVTITGSRSGLNVLMFYHAISILGLDKNTEKLKKMVNENIANATYLYQLLVEMFGKDRVYYPHQFNVSFPRPSQELARKYQLMLTGDKATICVLTNVNRRLIDQFIKDLKEDFKSDPLMQQLKVDLKKGSSTTLNTKLDKENVMTDKLDYIIKTLQGEHVKQVTDLFVKSFCDSEPITKHLGIRYQDYEPFAREVVQKAAKEGISKVALDKNNHVVACAIAEDMADPFIPHSAHYPKLKPILSLLEKLSDPFLSGKKFLPGKILHLWIAIVSPTVRGKGLSTEIDMACIEGAARKGFDFAYAEFTSAISEHVTKQFKTLELCNKINYDDFSLENGQRPFEGMTGRAAAYVASIRPGANLNTLSNCYKVAEKY